MISFSWTQLSGNLVELEIKTPVVRTGTLYRLTAAIYVLGLDIVEGDVDTLEEEGILYSQDRFLLQLADPQNRHDKNLQEHSSKLGILMETMLVQNRDPDEIFVEQGVIPPTRNFFFESPPEILFQDHRESNETQFYIETVNRTGLLFQLTRLLYREEINIVRATIRTTPFGTAEDTFYLQYGDSVLGQLLSRHLESLILGKNAGTPERE